jgi:hypothetical protein
LDIQNLSIRAIQFQFAKICISPITINVSGDRIASIAIPPFRLSPKRKRGTGNVAASRTRTSQTVTSTKKYRGNDDEKGCNGRSKEAKRSNSELVADSAAFPEERKGESFENGQSNQESINQTSQVCVIVNIRGKANQGIDEKVEAKPEDAAKAHPAS